MKILADQKWLCARVSERRFGNMRINLEESDSEFGVREAARRKFVEACGIKKLLVTPVLAHSAEIAVIENARIPYFSGIDALATRERSFAIGLTAADCAPVFIADPKSRALGLAHAGWRGVLQGVIPNTVLAMREAFGSDPKNLLVEIGPCIGACHFEVGNEVSKLFPKKARSKTGRKFFVDLATACRFELLNTGLQPKNIRPPTICTYCRADRFFSHRFDKHAPPLAMLAFATIL